MMPTRFPWKKTKRATWALVLASGLCAHTAYAGGFQVFAHGAKAVGSGYAQQASTDDASSAWWNPAAYGFAEHAQLGLAVHVLAPEGRFTNQGSTTYPPPPQGLPLTGNDGGKLNDLGLLGTSTTRSRSTIRSRSGLLSPSRSACPQVTTAAGSGTTTRSIRP